MQTDNIKDILAAVEKYGKRDEETFRPLWEHVMSAVEKAVPHDRAALDKKVSGWMEDRYEEFPAPSAHFAEPPYLMRLTVLAKHAQEIGIQPTDMRRMMNQSAEALGTSLQILSPELADTVMGRNRGAALTV